MCSVFSELTDYKVLFQTKHRGVFSVSLTSVLVYWGTTVSHAAASPACSQGQTLSRQQGSSALCAVPLLLVLEAS